MGRAAASVCGFETDVIPPSGLSLLLASLPVLLLGALLAVSLRSSRQSAVAALGSQGIAVACVLAACIPVLRSGTALETVWPWAPPIESIAFRLDALAAFFLVWSLPLTWLGTLYALS